MDEGTTVLVFKVRKLSRSWKTAQKFMNDRINKLNIRINELVNVYREVDTN